MWKKGTGAFLVQVRTLDRAGPLLRVQVRELRRDRWSLVLMHVGALIAQPLVAECTQALRKHGLRALGAALRKRQRQQPKKC